MGFTFDSYVFSFYNLLIYIDGTGVTVFEERKKMKKQK